MGSIVIAVIPAGLIFQVMYLVIIIIIVCYIISVTTCFIFLIFNKALK